MKHAMRELYAYCLGIMEEIKDADRRKLIRTYGSAKQAYMASDQEIRIVLEEHADRFLRGRLKLEKLKEQAEQELLNLKNRQIRYLPLEDRLYPERLKEITGCPYALYIKGELPDLTRAAAIVGSRRISPYGRKMAADLGTVLGRHGIPVVSGMARGVDSLAQEACLDAGGTTVAVLGCGVDVCYPEELHDLYGRIMENGCILSEFPPGTPPLPTHFPARNRIISGLSEVVAVVEAAEKSGSLITADMALEQGRDVFAVPGRVGDRNSSGCNRLIAQGAGIILSAGEFPDHSGLLDKRDADDTYSTEESIWQSDTYQMEALGKAGSSTNNREEDMKEKEADIPEDSLDEDSETCTYIPEEQVYHALDLYPKHISEIAQETGFEFTNLQILLTKLELSGRIRQVGTGFFHRI